MSKKERERGKSMIGGGSALYTKPNNTAKFSIILNKREKINFEE